MVTVIVSTVPAMKPGALALIDGLLSWTRIRPIDADADSLLV